MIKGLWIDVMFYEGEDPDAEVDADVCNGRVYTEEEVNLIKSKLECITTDCAEVREFLDEVCDKLGFGLECL
jgi:hypothetical protein